MEAKIRVGKTKKRGKAAVMDLLNNSNCVVARSYSVMGDLASIMFQISGALAHIPAAKNRKVMTKFGLVNSADTNNFLKALTLLVGGQLEPRDRFGDSSVYVAIACAARRRSFDTDNVYTTIRDFLEPAETKKGGATKSRGWGIGLINDDNQVVSGSCWNAEVIGAATDRTTICVCMSTSTLVSAASNFFTLHQTIIY